MFGQANSVRVVSLAELTSFAGRHVGLCAHNVVPLAISRVYCNANLVWICSVVDILIVYHCNY